MAGAIANSTPFRIALCAMMVCATRICLGQVQGDVDGDGWVTPLDAGMVKDHLLERTPLQGAALGRADANGDGRVTLTDVVWINSHPQEITVYLPGNVPLVLVRILPGSFQMGSPDTERGRNLEEGPLHAVGIAYSFYIGKFELTQRQWLALMGSWPDPNSQPTSDWGLGDNYAAYGLSWYDTQYFITALNNHVTSTSQGPARFRLPSEAEWEYACRAGTQTRFYFGDSLSVDDSPWTDGPAGLLPGNRSDYMWFSYNAVTPTTGIKPVGIKGPNQFGLHDLHGNVWEWCQDWDHFSYSGAPSNGSAWEWPAGYYRVLRSGYFGSPPSYCRSAYRMSDLPTDRKLGYGFRVARGP